MSQDVAGRRRGARGRGERQVAVWGHQPWRTGVLAWPLCRAARAGPQSPPLGVGGQQRPVRAQAAPGQPQVPGSRSGGCGAGRGSGGLPACPFPTGLVPLGALGSVEFTLATLPLISNQYIELDINVSAGRGPCRCPGVAWVGTLGPGRGSAARDPPVPFLVPAAHREERSW